MSKPLAHDGKSQPAAQTSWANKVSVSDSSTRFTLESLSRQPLGHRLVISEDMLLDNVDQWNRCMVGLSMAASMIGRPLSCDESTYNCTRLDYARVCVEVDASLPYVHDFEIESPLTSEPITVKVDYEWKPSRCEKCHIFGHSFPITPPLQMNKGKLPVTNPTPIHNLDILQPQMQPSTSTLPVPPTSTTMVTLSLITSPKPPLPELSIPPLPIEPVALAEPIVAPQPPPSLPPTKNPPLPIPTSTDILHTIVASTNLNPWHISILDATVCQESKMASLRSQSESSNAMETSTAETASMPLSESHDESPNYSPKTVRKKKGGKKHKEARGLQWFCCILVGWNPHKISLTCVNASSQWLTYEITTPSLLVPLRVTFIYGHNTPAARTILWNYLCHESSLNGSTPWLILGDFNTILHAGDRSGGDINWYHHQNDFNNCIRQAELIQVPYTGIKYSWHGQQGEFTIQKKLDWLFGNTCLFSKFPATDSVFMPRLISDHSVMLFHFTAPTSIRP
uniref:Endonuclease/exonuclease/phosphatase domain-containing protein n=1 Tax=Populus alba TaxID=43335 RepID=A0A4U5PNW0_POPAL|nr:hypothetical protein D5086_0000206770 [Populus alba]